MTRAQRRRRDRRNGRPLRRAVTVVLTMLLVGGLATGIAFAGWVVSVVNDTPDIESLRPKPQGAVSTVYAADGSRLGFISSDILRSVAKGDRIPRGLKQATVAIEDRRFYQHGGVDYLGILRAAVKNVTADRAAQGGSTLTMQLVRNVYIPKVRFQKTLTRKIREAALADELEQIHSKEWILDSYLNNVPYGTVGGQTAVGVQAAARIFFNKPLSRLTLPEEALLAGLPQGPTRYNPFLNPTGARKRRGEVLRAMVTAHYITQAQADRAAAAPLGVRHTTYYSRRREQFFFDYVKSELIKRYGAEAVRQGGLKVYTTIDLRLQGLAQQAIADHLNQPDQPAAALVTIDPSNGHILAMASSATYGPTVFNYATQGHRQPGSTFKAIDLMAALRLGIDPDTTYYDSHELMPGWLSSAPTWHVQTDDHAYSGNITLTEALAKSDNTVYAQLGADITPQRITQAAHDLGVTSHLDSYPAEAIGGLTRGVTTLEMANAYATIADGGWRNTATAIAKVVHPDGKVDDVGKPRRKKEFTDGQTAKAISALEGVITHGTATNAAIGCPAAGKTGTTSSFTDAWFVGFTPKLSTAVWVGYPSATTSMYSVPGYGEVFGATIPAPIWQEFMQSAIGDSCEDFPAPKEPFVSSSFSGEFMSAPGASSYADSSGDDEQTDEGDDDAADQTQGDGTDTGTGATPAPQAQDAPQGNGNGNGNAGNGNGNNGNGNGNGDGGGGGTGGDTGGGDAGSGGGTGAPTG